MGAERREVAISGPLRAVTDIGVTEQIVEAEMGAEHGLKPAGCTCHWAQIHMDMPWQRLSTAADCPVHNVNLPESQAIAEATAWQHPDSEWIG